MPLRPEMPQLRRGWTPRRRLCTATCPRATDGGGGDGAPAERHPQPRWDWNGVASGPAKASPWARRRDVVLTSYSRFTTSSSRSDTQRPLRVRRTTRERPSAVGHPTGRTHSRRGHHVHPGAYPSQYLWRDAAHGDGQRDLRPLPERATGADYVTVHTVVGESVKGDHGHRQGGDSHCRISDTRTRPRCSR